MKQPKIPRHISIILDGNRRYSKKLGMKVWQGHKFGTEKVKDILEWCLELKIKELTLYSFSMDNFKRPEKEKKVLFSLFKKSIDKLKNDERLDKYGIRISFIGRLGKFPENIQKEMDAVMRQTSKNKKFRLNFAMAYSGKAEITDALKKIIGKIKKNKIKMEDIDENLVGENLYLNSNPDILIRPGGEKKISDFLLWQISYSEIFFIEKLWPEFTKEDLIEVIREFNQRERRFGK